MSSPLSESAATFEPFMEFFLSCFLATEFFARSFFLTALFLISLVVTLFFGSCSAAWAPPPRTMNTAIVANDVRVAESLPHPSASSIAEVACAHCRN
jgi:hypothetical protein